MTFRIDVRKGNKWVERTTISTTPKGRALTSPSDALRHGYGIRPTNRNGSRGRTYLGEATSKSGKRFRAVQV